MRKQRSIVRLTITTLAVASLMSSVALMPIRPARAQTVGGSWTFTGSLRTPRYGHTATLLRTGKVLVAAGDSKSAELYDPATGTWSYTGFLTSRRITHSATLLQNGQVLVAGGYDYTLITPTRPPDLNTVELYDPASGTWRPAANLITTYIAHRATLLQNGKVLVVGLQRGSEAISTELYDPDAGTWTSTGTPNVFGFLTLLASGKVLVTGTRDSKVISEVYDPTTQTWGNTTNANVINYANGVTLLQNGKVLIIGQADANGSIPAAELYDPTTGSWSVTGNPLAGSGGFILLADGRVLATATFDPSTFLPINGAELYDPGTGSWSRTNHLNEPRLGHTATLLPDGRVLVAGGNNGDYDWLTVFNSAELGTPPATPVPNQIDDAEFIVRQHYRDFLNREPDAEGLAFWINEITACGSDSGCIAAKRISVSAAFFRSIEFQETGYLVHRIYKASFGDTTGTSTFAGTHPLAVPVIRLNEFLPDTQQIGNGLVVNQSGWETVLENNNQAFATEFVQRSRFTTAFPQSMTAAQFVDTLNANAGGPLSESERNLLVSDLSAGAKTRAQVLRAVAEDQDMNKAEFNRAFVLMQYFGYLRRNPNDPQDTDHSGYDFWLNKLNQFNGNFMNAEMVKAFITSTEYRQRFGQP